MQLRRHDIEDPLQSVGGGPAGLFRDEGHRIGLVGKPQFSLGIPGVARIEEDSAGNQVAMEIGHQRSDVAAVLRLHLFRRFSVEGAHGELHASGPPIEVALIHAEVDPMLRYAKVLV